MLRSTLWYMHGPSSLWHIVCWNSKNRRLYILFTFRIGLFYIFFLTTTEVGCSLAEFYYAHFLYVCYIYLLVVWCILYHFIFGLSMLFWFCYVKFSCFSTVLTIGWEEGFWNDLLLSRLGRKPEPNQSKTRMCLLCRILIVYVVYWVFAAYTFQLACLLFENYWLFQVTLLTIPVFWTTGTLQMYIGCCILYRIIVTWTVY